jgi:hypothetical protein
MKLPTHSGCRVSAMEVRLVLDQTRQFSCRQWAEFFRVNPQTIKSWRTKGTTLDLWSGPSWHQWNALKAEAISSLREGLRVLEGTSRNS